MLPMRLYGKKRMRCNTAMIRNGITAHAALLVIECTAVCVFLLLPPLFSTEPFILPPKPEDGYALIVFCCKTIYAAAYEEVLYRLYTPYRLSLIYTDYIVPRLQAMRSREYGSGTVVQKSSLANGAAVFFFTEAPALFLFAFAHRYLGLGSLIFAAGAGILFRVAYCMLKRVLPPAGSIAIVAGLHGLWNIGVYFYFWVFSFTAYARH